MVINMSQIILGLEKIKAYEGLKMLCGYADKSEQWCDGLWMDMLTDPELYGEFVYYLENHSLADKMKIEGYSLTDFYVWQMERYNLANDSGKNTDICNKEEMVLQSFKTMAEMKKNPEYYKRKLTEGSGMDKE